MEDRRDERYWERRRRPRPPPLLVVVVGIVFLVGALFFTSDILQKALGAFFGILAIIGGLAWFYYEWRPYKDNLAGFVQFRLSRMKDRRLMSTDDLAKERWEDEEAEAWADVARRGPRKCRLCGTTAEGLTCPKCGSQI